MKIISLRCPDCNAHLSIEEGHSYCFCNYCGAKIFIQNENEIIYRRIDEAKIKQAENDQILKIKELELKEKELSRASTIKKAKIIIVAAILLTGILLVIAGAIMLSHDSDGGIFIGVGMIMITFMFLSLLIYLQNK